MKLGLRMRAINCYAQLRLPRKTRPYIMQGQRLNLAGSNYWHCLNVVCDCDDHYQMTLLTADAISLTRRPPTAVSRPLSALMSRGLPTTVPEWHSLATGCLRGEGSKGQSVWLWFLPAVAVFLQVLGRRGGHFVSEMLKI